MWPSWQSRLNFELPVMLLWQTYVADDDKEGHSDFVYKIGQIIRFLKYWLLSNLELNN